MVGNSYVSGSSNQHAFLYSDGKMTDLGTFGGPTSNGRRLGTASQERRGDKGEIGDGREEESDEGGEAEGGREVSKMKMSRRWRRRTKAS